MTKDGILDLLEIITLEYDGFEVSEKMVALWGEMLGDISDEVGMAAIKVVMLKSQFRPRVADIRAAALSLVNPECEIDASQAWALVLMAVRVYGSYQAEKALASLPATVANAARRVGWVDLCTGEEEISRAHFLKMFASMQAREKELGVLPPALQAHIRQAALESAPVSVAQLTAPEKLALPNHPATASGRVSGYTPPQNMLAFRRKPQPRTPEELRQQAEILRGETTKTAESAEFVAMTENERAEYLKQQAQQLGGAA